MAEGAAEKVERRMLGELVLIPLFTGEALAVSLFTEVSWLVLSLTWLGDSATDGTRRCNSLSTRSVDRRLCEDADVDGVWKRMRQRKGVVVSGTEAAGAADGKASDGDAAPCGGVGASSMVELELIAIDMELKWEMRCWKGAVASWLL